MSFEMKTDGQLMKERGLNAGGRVQNFIDDECIRRMDPYTPRIHGKLIQAATDGTKIGSGIIVQAAPQARYLYYGKLMVSKLTGSAFASHEESKVLASPEKDLKYNTDANPKAGKMWFERMKKDHKEDILAGAQKMAAGGHR